MLDALDQSVGVVVEALSDTGMLDNTIIVFTSDNGASPWGTHGNRGFNWPLRGAKFTLWEGGIRASAFIWSPLLRNRRRVSNDLMHITDWLPTLYAAAGECLFMTSWFREASYGTANTGNQAPNKSARI